MAKVCLERSDHAPPKYTFPKNYKNPSSPKTKKQSKTPNISPKYQRTKEDPELSKRNRVKTQHRVPKVIKLLGHRKVNSLIFLPNENELKQILSSPQSTNQDNISPLSSPPKIFVSHYADKFQKTDVPKDMPKILYPSVTKITSKPDSPRLIEEDRRPELIKHPLNNIPQNIVDIDKTSNETAAIQPNEIHNTPKPPPMLKTKSKKSFRNIFSEEEENPIEDETKKAEPPILKRPPPMFKRKVNNQPSESTNNEVSEIINPAIVVSGEEISKKEINDEKPSAPAKSPPPMLKKKSKKSLRNIFAEEDDITPPIEVEIKKVESPGLKKPPPMLKRKINNQLSDTTNNEVVEKLSDPAKPPPPMLKKKSKKSLRNIFAEEDNINPAIGVSPNAKNPKILINEESLILDSLKEKKPDKPLPTLRKESKKSLRNIFAEDGDISPTIIVSQIEETPKIAITDQTPNKLESNMEITEKPDKPPPMLKKKSKKSLRNIFEDGEEERETKEQENRDEPARPMAKKSEKSLRNLFGKEEVKVEEGAKRLIKNKSGKSLRNIFEEEDDSKTGTSPPNIEVPEEEEQAKPLIQKRSGRSLRNLFEGEDSTPNLSNMLGEKSENLDNKSSEEEQDLVGAPKSKYLFSAATFEKKRTLEPDPEYRESHFGLRHLSKHSSVPLPLMRKRSERLLSPPVWGYGGCRKIVEIEHNSYDCCPDPIPEFLPQNRNKEKPLSLKEQVLEQLRNKKLYIPNDETSKLLQEQFNKAARDIHDVVKPTRKKVKVIRKCASQIVVVSCPFSNEAHPLATKVPDKVTIPENTEIELITEETKEEEEEVTEEEESGERNKKFLFSKKGNSKHAIYTRGSIKNMDDMVCSPLGDITE